MINFSNVSERFPRHLCCYLKTYTDSHSNELVFINLRGKAVDGAHLNQAFARASKKFRKKNYSWRFA